MKYSLSWLNEWVTHDASCIDICEKLLQLGFEVSDISLESDIDDKVIVAKIKSCIQHPDADKLKICTVDVGSAEDLTIVCGASNAREGLQVILAQVGSKLPGNFKIKKSNIRGKASFGMLCSWSELGLDKNQVQDGIAELDISAPLGTPIIEIDSLVDKVIDLEITPNRGDCLSHFGLAREIAAAFNGVHRKPSFQEFIATPLSKCIVNVNAKLAVNIYTCRIASGIDHSVVLPSWLLNRLNNAQIASVNPVVDILNYTMLDLGVPLHAFDKKAIGESLCVRHSQKGEKIRLLNGSDIVLDDTTLVVTNSRDEPCAIAGIMGSEDSKVTIDTDEIVIECAHFDAKLINKASQNYRLHSDSSYRFSRGVDSCMIPFALDSATQLMLDHKVISSIGQTVIRGEPKYQPRKINLTRDKVFSCIGKYIPDDDIADSLSNLDFSITSIDDGIWEVEVPSHRNDCAVSVDLIEEILRATSIDAIVPSFVSHVIKAPVTNAWQLQRKIRQACISTGLNEVITYSFIDDDSETMFGNKKSDFVLKLKNPLSKDMSVMRSQFISSHINLLKYHIARQVSSISIFELGHVYEKISNDSLEKLHLSGLISSVDNNSSWQNFLPNSFFTISAKVQQICKFFGKSILVKPVDCLEYAHPGQQAAIYYNNKKIGFIYMLSPKILLNYDIKQDVFGFSMEVDWLVEEQTSNLTEPSIYPFIRRDLVLLVDSNIYAYQVLELINSMKIKQVVDCFIFDNYQPENLPEDKKSIGVAIIFQDSSKTLKDASVDKMTNTILSKLEKNLSLQLRNY